MLKAFSSLFNNQLSPDQKKIFSKLLNQFLGQADSKGVIALHYHWCLATQVKNSFPVTDDFKDLDPNNAAILFFDSRFKLIAVWYALLYVVVEGYQSLKTKDEKIDILLKEKVYLQKLRRFRNSLFHFQTEIESPKYSDFLMENQSAEWIQDLHLAFKNFFESVMPVEEMISVLRKK